jgi:hypothetical protein
MQIIAAAPIQCVSRTTASCGLRVVPVTLLIPKGLANSSPGAGGGLPRRNRRPPVREQGKDFFFEKKKQKTFDPLGFGLSG